MFDSYKQLKSMKEHIKTIKNDCHSEINDCDDYLKDLPEDISSVDELSKIIDNNKDLLRAFDLGKKIAYQEILDALKKL